MREDLRLGVQVGKRVGKKSGLLCHLPVLLGVLFPFQAQAGHVVLKLAQLQGKAFAALTHLLLFRLEALQRSLLLLKRTLRGVQLIQGSRFRHTGSGFLVGFLQGLDIALDLPDDFLLLPDPVGQALAGGSGAFLLQADAAVLLPEVTHAFLRLAVLLFKSFKGSALLLQHLAAGRHVGGKLRLGRARLHILKLSLHPVQVRAHPVDDLSLLLDTRVDGIGCLPGLSDKDIHGKAGLVKAAGQVVLHQKFNFYGLHRLQF